MPRPPELPEHLKRTGSPFAMCYASAILTDEFMTAPDSAKRVYLSLCLHAERSSRSWELSAKLIASETRLSVRSVRRAVRELCARGLVTRLTQRVSTGGRELDCDSGWQLANVYVIRDEGPKPVDLCGECDSPFHTTDEHSYPQDRGDSAVTPAPDTAVTPGVTRLSPPIQTTTDQETDPPVKSPQADGAGDSAAPPSPPDGGNPGKWDEDQVRFCLEGLAAAHRTDPDGCWWERASRGEGVLVAIVRQQMVESSNQPEGYNGSCRRRTIRPSLIEAFWRHQLAEG